MGVLASFKAAREQADASSALYVACVDQARSPTFFTHYGVPDTVDGRFDLIILHTMLLIRRLRQQGKGAAEVSQAVLNLMFADMDRNLREMGVGDLSVGRQVKKMAKAFYGRAEAWEEAMDVGADELAASLAETLYRASDASGEVSKLLSAYVISADAHLTDQPIETITDGRVDFPVPEIVSPAA